MTMQTKFFGLGLLVAGTLAAASTGESAPANTQATVVAPLAGDARAGKETFTEYC